jgi:parallel beta-helix repeat protein
MMEESTNNTIMNNDAYANRFFGIQTFGTASTRTIR